MQQECRASRRELRPPASRLGRRRRGQATVTGKQELVRLAIDPSAVDPDDVEMLQDLVVAAVNDAHPRVARAAEARRWARSPAASRLPGM